MAERLQITHHSDVGLCTRTEQLDLIKRTTRSQDRRQVCVRLTAKGERVLSRIVIENQPKLDRLLEDILQEITMSTADTKTKAKR